MSNIHHDNQRVYCINNNVPFFASSSCSHTSKWMIDDDRYAKEQTLSDMLVQEYGEEKAFVISSSTHITGCPVCGRSWCD